MKSMPVPLPGRLGDLLPLLRCPRTGSELEVAEDLSLVSRDGGRHYRVVSGVPVLIDEDRSLMDVRWIVSVPPEPARPSNGRSPGADNYRRLAELLKVRAASGRQPRVLLFTGHGGDPVGDELLGCAELQLIQTGIELGPETDVVCDSHELPFADGSFDAVVIPGVLECVIYPQRVVSEVHRVLADHGLVYSEAGFIRQAGAGPLDFNRYTHLGHRRMWRFFDEVDSGAQRGPGTALLWSVEHFLRALAGRNRAARWAIARGVALAGFGVRYLDRFLVHRPAGIDAASGTFFMGTRRDTPLSDRALVAGFRGELPPGARLPVPRRDTAEFAGVPADEEIRVSRGIRIRRRERSTSGV
jgi:uncharacterized protein YbaR (Trm112 family)